MRDNEMNKQEALRGLRSGLASDLLRTYAGAGANPSGLNDIAEKAVAAATIVYPDIDSLPKSAET